MKNTVRTGAGYHRFKRQEGFIIHKLDGPKRPTREADCDRQDIPRHKDINEQGRSWTF